MINKAVFFDRDGTINIEKNYLFKFEDVEFIEGIPEFIKLLNRLGYLVIVVTNQAGVARGYYTENDVVKLHTQMNQALIKDYDAHIDHFYYCPHHPKGLGEYQVDCDCRKPKSGMLLKAISDYNIDILESFMIGDKAIDIIAGENIGIKSYCIDDLKSLREVIEANSK